MRTRLIAAALVVFGLAPAGAETPSPQAAAITEGLDWFCAEWMKPGAGDAVPPRHETGLAAGWREFSSAAPAVGPIMVKGGEWGRANLVRVVQDAGHRCSITLQLSRTGWTTDIAHQAVSAWAQKTFPDAIRQKDRGAGPRETRETIWRAESDLTLTLQEAPAPGAQPNVFITLARDDRRPAGI